MTETAALETIRSGIVRVLMTVLPLPPEAEPAVRMWAGAIDVGEVIDDLTLAVPLLLLDYALASINRDHGLTEDQALAEYTEIAPTIREDWPKMFSGGAPVDYHTYSIEIGGGAQRSSTSSARRWTTSRRGWRGRARDEPAHRQYAAVASTPTARGPSTAGTRFPTMLTEVRSYALALWIYSKGHEPVDAGISPGGTLVFTFRPEASKEISSYNDAKAVFNELEAKARSARSRA